MVLDKAMNDTRCVLGPMKRTSSRPTFTVLLHDEPENRYISPLSLCVVRIPGAIWPNAIVGVESTGDNRSVYRGSLATNWTHCNIRFLRDWWTELNRVIGGNSTTATHDPRGSRTGDMYDVAGDNFGTNAGNNACTNGYIMNTTSIVNNSGNSKSTSGADSFDRGTIDNVFSAPNANIYSRIREYVVNITGDRIDRDGNIASDSLTEHEYTDSCLPCVMTLGTTRTVVPEQIRNSVLKFHEHVKTLNIVILDIKQCENLLRRTIRAYYSENLAYPLMDEQGGGNSTALVPVLEFDKSRALEEVVKSDVETTIKECVAFVSALQNRKWQTAQQITMLRRKIRDYEDNRSSLNLNTPIAGDIYRTTVKQLQNEQGNVVHLSQQIDAMQKLIDLSRHTLIQIYTNLYNNWNEINDLTRTLTDTLRTYRVQTPDVVQTCIRRDSYTLDFFRCVEMMRRTNTLIMKLIEDAYDDTFNQVLPEQARGTNASNMELGQTNNEHLPLRDMCDTTAGRYSSDANENEESRSRDKLLSAVRQLNRTIRQTREHYSTGAWEHGPSDIRQMALAYYRLFNVRLTTLKLLMCKLSQVQLTSAATTTATPAAAENVPQNVNVAVATLLNKQETDCSATLEIDVQCPSEENEPRPDDDDGSATTNETSYRCRRFGDTIVMLREAQDSYDTPCLFRMLDVQFNRLLANRFSFSNQNINRDSEQAKWDERRMVDELEQATRSTFKENVGTWDRLIQRVQMYEREAIIDHDTMDKRGPRVPISGRLQNWSYRNYDPFNFTLIHARFTQIDSTGELVAVQKTVSRYAYLLSWMLQMRVYVTVGNHATDDEIDNEIVATSTNSSDEHRRQFDSTDPSRQRQRPATKRHRDGTTVDGQPGANEDEDDTDDAAPPRQVRRIASDRSATNGSSNDRERNDYNNADDNADDNDEDVVMRSTSLDSDTYNDGEDVTMRDETGTITIGTRPNDRRPATSQRLKSQRPRPYQSHGTAEQRRLRQRSRNRGGPSHNLQRLQRLAENAPSNISVRMLNDMYRDEMTRKRTLQTNIRKRLNELRGILSSDAGSNAPSTS